MPLMINASMTNTGLNNPLASGNRRVVVADDDPDILDALKMMLEICDYEVETIADGAVVSRLEKSQPKLLLLDIWMSGTDGRDICKELKSKKATRNIPVIMISATRDLEKSSKDAGANDFLEKPFDMNDLLTKVEKYLPN